MAQPIQTIGLIGKYGDDTVGKDIHRLARYLDRRKLTVVLEDHTAGLLEADEWAHYSMDAIGRHIDLAIVIGGDGTMLHVARQLVDFQVPLVGINLGRLGFLTDIPADDMESAIGRILDGDYETEQRFLLHAEVLRGGKVVHGALALNDVVVNKGELARLIEFETYIDGEFVNSARADGVIVATPTGSTAYALSAGGPIIHPTLAAVVIVPICPHTLSDRPLVVSSDSVIQIVPTELGGQRSYLSFDGQFNFSLTDRDHIYVRRAKHPLTLVHPCGRSHYAVLRAKLQWGGKL